MNELSTATSLFSPLLVFSCTTFLMYLFLSLAEKVPSQLIVAGWLLPYTLSFPRGWCCYSKECNRSKKENIFIKLSRQKLIRDNFI